MKKIYFLVVLSLLITQSYAQLTGTINVPSAVFPNLSAVVDSLNNQGVGNGGVTFVIKSDTVLNQNGGVVLTTTGTAQNPIVIKSESLINRATIYFFGGSAVDKETMIKFKGSDYITFEGLILKDTTALFENTFYLDTLLSNGCKYNTIKNCWIEMRKSNVNATYGVNYLIKPSSIDGSNSFNHFYNNTVKNISVAYYFYNNVQNIDFFDEANEVGAFQNNESIIDNAALCGVYMHGQKGAKVFNNKISNIVKPSAGTLGPAAIYTASATPSGNINIPCEIYNNEITNVSTPNTSVWGLYLSARKMTYNIYNNKISGIHTSGTSNETASGILLIATTINANVYNNFIFDIASPSGIVTGVPATQGIYVRITDNANIYNNTILIDYTPLVSGSQSAALFVNSTSCIMDLRNNIFVNRTQKPIGFTGLVTSVYNKNLTLANYTSSTNNNIYYAGLPSSQNLIFYGYSTTTPIKDSTLAQYKTFAATVDQQSYTEDPYFVSATDLHIDESHLAVSACTGQPINTPFSITTDIDGNLRDTQTPDIGADEYLGGFSANVTFNVLSNSLPVDSAYIIFNDDSLYTDANGSVVFTIVSPQLDAKYSISKNNYFPIIDSIDIVRRQIIIDIDLMKISDKNQITSFTISNQIGETVIDSILNKVNVTMPYGFELDSLLPTILISEFAAINPASGVVKDFTSPVIYTVTAQNGVQKQWTVNVVNALNNESDIISLTIPNQVGNTIINNTMNRVNVVMPYGVSLNSLTPIIEVSVGATINPLSGVAQNFTDSVIYIVKAQNGNEQQWVVKVVNELNTENDILSFTVASQVSPAAINSGVHTVNLIVGLGTSLTSITPTITVSPDAAVNPASGIAQNFTNAVNYTVTAQDGTQQIWVVTIGVVDDMEKLSSNLFKIYPNPANDLIYINFKNNDKYSVELLDVNGRVILTKVFEKNIKNSIDISTLKAGEYFLKAQSSDKIKIEKLIIK